MHLILNTYPYVALDAKTREIRLLVLLPGQFNDHVECALRHVSLSKSPKYEALSYCWGDLKSRKLISLDGHRFLATESLEIALRYLRCQDTPRILWIDAVCINQADDRERSQQVGLMGEIYRSAQRVTVWLGEEEGKEEVGRDGLFQSVSRAGWSPPTPKSISSTDGTRQQGCLIDGIDIIPLYRRPWWWRIWVIQEVAVSTRTAVTVQYGRHTQQWQKLSGSWGSHFFRGGLADDSLTKPYEIISSLQRTLWFGGRMRLTDLLEQFRFWKATDPRDKVYALIGLSTGAGRDFPIDYTKSVTRVYMDLVIHLISLDKNLDILSHSSVSRTLGDLPLWAPDWSSGKNDSLPPGRLPLRWRHSRCEQWYAASADREAQVILKHPNILVVSGFVFDAIRFIGQELQPDDMSIQSTTIDEWEAMALGTTEANDPYSGQDGRLEAFCRTLIADIGGDGTRAKEQMFGQFLSWCKRPRLPPKESMSLKVAKALGYIADEKDTSRGEDSDEYTYKPRGEARVIVNKEFHDAYESRKESLSKHEMLNLSEEELFNLCNESLESDRACQDFRQRMGEVAVGRRLIISNRGYMGIAHENSKQGDIICILFGGRAPFILRAAAKGGHHLVGECYVHGIMDGETLDDDGTALPPRECPVVQDFILV
jgi:hypothetical protein